MTVRRFIITGDFLRVDRNGEATQDINIRWLFHLLRPVLEQLSPFPVRMQRFDNSALGISACLYAHNGLPCSLASWARLYAKQPDTRELALLYARFEDALVIGFELPDLVRNGFERLEIPYLDFTIHPVRFLPDLLFGVRSNIRNLGHALRYWSVSENEIRIGAGRAMARLSRLPRKRDLETPARIALFAAQTPDDKVRIHQGRFSGYDDFEACFAALLRHHDRVLVKAHPCAPDDENLKRLLLRFPALEPVPDNLYYLISHESIERVYSLNSSASVEAAYLGVPGTHFAPYPSFFSSKELSSTGYLTIGSAFVGPDFWQTVLRHLGLPCTERQAHSQSLLPDISLRQSLGISWAAVLFQDKS